MKVKTNPSPLYTHATEAFYAAAEDTLQYARVATAPVVSGAYRDSLKVKRRTRTSKKGETRLTATIGSNLPYAGALDRGAGPHRGWQYQGPHIQRNDAPRPLVKAAAKFEAFFVKRLGTTPMPAVGAYIDVGHGATYEQVPTELSLGVTL